MARFYHFPPPPAQSGKLQDLSKAPVPGALSFCVLYALGVRNKTLRPLRALRVKIVSRKGAKIAKDLFHAEDAETSSTAIELASNISAPLW